MHNELEETWIRTALSVMRGLHADAVLLYSIALLPFIGRICNFHAPECEARIPASCNQMITSIIYQFIFSLLYFFFISLVAVWSFLVIFMILCFNVLDILRSSMLIAAGKI